MGRQVRRVPSDWQHPKNEQGHYIPMFGRSYSKEASAWDEGKRQWSAGFRAKTVFHEGGGWHDEWVPKEAEYDGMDYTDWTGSRPVSSDYMPDWPEDQRTHWQMYEDTSEGTPISPVMETPEELARWLADNDASAFAGMTATYDQWLATIRRHWSGRASQISRGRGGRAVIPTSRIRRRRQEPTSEQMP
jgi:hypothetical protein